MQQGDLHGPAVMALCVRAKYSKEESLLIAWASWMTDESSITQVKWPWQMFWNNPGPYYHFIASRSGVVEANSERVRALVKYADTPIRLGMALHAFMDSYSHAGYVGRMSKINIMGLGKGYWFFPPYGHTQMLRHPDRAEVTWFDTRTGELRQNHNIFREALAATAGLLKVNIRIDQIEDILKVTRIANYDARKLAWAKLAGMPDIRFSQVQKEFWPKHKPEFKAAAVRQRKFLK